MTYQSPNCWRRVVRSASRGSSSASAAASSVSVTSGSWSGAGTARGSPTRLSRPPDSTTGVTSAAPLAVSWSVVSDEPSADPASPAPVSRSTLPRTSDRASSRSMPSIALSVSKGSRGSVTCSLSSRMAVQAGGSAEDGEDALGEGQVEAGDERDHDGDEDDHHGGVGDQLLAARPDDLAQLGDDLPEEAPDAALVPQLRGAGALRGGPRPGALTLAGLRGPARRTVGDLPAAPGRGGDDLVLVGLGTGRDVGLGRLELGGVVDARGLRVELLGVEPLAGGLAVLLAHNASLYSIGWSGSSVVAGVTGLEPAACGFGDRCSAN